MCAEVCAGTDHLCHLLSFQGVSLVLAPFFLVLGLQATAIIVVLCSVPLVVVATIVWSQGIHAAHSNAQFIPLVVAAVLAVILSVRPSPAFSSPPPACLPHTHITAHIWVHVCCVW